jgi:hypothetical protein
VFVILRSIRALVPLALSLFQNSNFFLSQNNVLEIVLSCFLILRIKQSGKNGAAEVAGITERFRIDLLESIIFRIGSAVHFIAISLGIRLQQH